MIHPRQEVWQLLSFEQSDLHRFQHQVLRLFQDLVNFRAVPNVSVTKFEPSPTMNAPSAGVNPATSVNCASNA